MKSVRAALAAAIMLTVTALPVQAYNVVDLPEKMTLADAVEIYDVSDISAVTISDIGDDKFVTLDSDDIKSLYYSVQGVELTRRINPTPFRGINVSFYTTDGRVENFCLTSGVQIGKYGSRNYVCYAMSDEDLMDYMYLDSMYREIEEKEQGVTLSPKLDMDFLKLPEDLWAVDSIKEAAARSLLPYELTSDYGAYISREDFCILLGNFIAVTAGYATIEDYMEYNGLYYDDGAFADCVGKDPSICILNALGIVSGKSGVMFEPDACLTREEAAKMVTETAAKFRYIGTGYNPNYADKNQISEWAQFYVKWVSEQGVMK